ncbi:MAG: maleylacetoacetate isomerase [Proteobacteria bacterium]|nr:maleylacetoacetate isomerase [Pseudomonadota bacterium]
MELFTYWRSSTAYRVRIVLGLKNLSADLIPINLIKGEQRSPENLARNPLGAVPSLKTDEGMFIQSLAILEYLEETHPTPALLPLKAADRARVRALCQTVACDMHPVNNLRLLKYLTTEMGLSEEKKMQWYRHWIAEGFKALEAQLRQTAGRYCFGDTITLADACLVPQVYNALRFDCPMADYPTVMRIHTTLEKHPAFIAAHPDNQPDAIKA